MSKPLGPAWIAGPVAYDWRVNYVIHEHIEQLGWNFVGSTRSGEFRRYRLRYNTVNREWSGETVSLNLKELAQSARLVEFYRPQAIQRDLLPKGALVEALKGMLTKEDLAAAMAVSIKQRNQSKPTF